MTLQSITDYLESIGCEFPEIGLLQPADPFLDTIGEDLRRRIFITSDNSGETLCLRPEFTVPVCLAHLKSGRKSGTYAYSGKVFRQRETGMSEFLQAGYENLGAVESVKADIDCIRTAVESLASAGVAELKLVLGEQAMFESLLDALEIPGAWRKKLLRSFGDTELLAANVKAMAEDNGYPELPEELAALLAKHDREAVTSWIEDQMEYDGLPLSGGRTASAITARLFEKFELAESRLEPGKRSCLEGYLSIRSGPVEALARIEKLERSAGIDLSVARERLSALLDGIGNLPVETEFRASFGRRLDYYTGFVFELYHAGENLPVSGGGRYDRLLTLLGSKDPVPAVGFSVWLDRLSGKEGTS